jgi:hypothetical protein
VFRKYSHSLGPDELEYLEEVLKKHDISDEDVEMSIELIAKEYNKQDGLYPLIYSPHENSLYTRDATMKVSLQINEAGKRTHIWILRITCTLSMPTRCHYGTGLPNEEVSRSESHSTE